MFSQKFSLIMILILTVVFFITATYAPWEYTWAKPGMTLITSPAGFHSVFSSPATQNPRFAYFGVRIMWPLYFIEIAVLGSALFFLWRFYLRREWPRDDEWEYGEDCDE